MSKSLLISGMSSDVEKSNPVFLPEENTLEFFLACLSKHADGLRESDESRLGAIHSVLKNDDNLKIEFEEWIKNQNILSDIIPRSSNDLQSSIDRLHQSLKEFLNYRQSVPILNNEINNDIMLLHDKASKDSNEDVGHDKSSMITTSMQDQAANVRMNSILQHSRTGMNAVDTDEKSKSSRMEEYKENDVMIIHNNAELYKPQHVPEQPPAKSTSNIESEIQMKQQASLQNSNRQSTDQEQGVYPESYDSIPSLLSNIKSAANQIDTMDKTTKERFCDDVNNLIQQFQIMQDSYKKSHFIKNINRNKNDHNNWNKNRRGDSAFKNLTYHLRSQSNKQPSYSKHRNSNAQIRWNALPKDVLNLLHNIEAEDLLNVELQKQLDVMIMKNKFLDQEVTESGKNFHERLNSQRQRIQLELDERSKSSKILENLGGKSVGLILKQEVAVKLTKNLIQENNLLVENLNSSAKNHIAAFDRLNNFMSVTESFILSAEDQKSLAQHKNCLSETMHKFGPIKKRYLECKSKLEHLSISNIKDPNIKQLSVDFNGAPGDIPKIIDYLNSRSEHIKEAIENLVEGSIILMEGSKTFLASDNNSVLEFCMNLIDSKEKAIESSKQTIKLKDEELSKLTQNIQDIEEQLKKLQDKHAELDAAHKLKESQISESKVLDENQSKILNELLEKSAEYQKEIAIIEESIKNDESLIEQKKKKLEESNQIVSDLSASISSTIEKMKNLEMNVKKTKTELLEQEKKSKSELADLKTKCTKVHHSLLKDTTIVENNIKALQNELATKKSSLENVKKEYEDVIDKLTKLDSDRTEKENLLKSETVKLDSIEKNILEYTKKRENNEAELEKLISEMDRRGGTVNCAVDHTTLLQNDIRSHIIELNLLKSQIDFHKEQVSMYKSKEKQHRSQLEYTENVVRNGLKQIEPLHSEDEQKVHYEKKRNLDILDNLYLDLKKMLEDTSREFNETYKMQDMQNCILLPFLQLCGIQTALTNIHPSIVLALITEISDEETYHELNVLYRSVVQPLYFLYFYSDKIEHLRDQYPSTEDICDEADVNMIDQLNSEMTEYTYQKKLYYSTLRKSKKNPSSFIDSIYNDLKAKIQKQIDEETVAIENSDTEQKQLCGKCKNEMQDASTSGIASRNDRDLTVLDDAFEKSIQCQIKSQDENFSTEEFGQTEKVEAEKYYSSIEKMGEQMRNSLEGMSESTGSAANDTPLEKYQDVSDNSDDQENVSPRSLVEDFMPGSLRSEAHRTDSIIKECKLQKEMDTNSLIEFLMLEFDRLKVFLENYHKLITAKQEKGSISNDMFNQANCKQGELHAEQDIPFSTETHVVGDVLENLECISSALERLRLSAVRRHNDPVRVYYIGENYDDSHQASQTVTESPMLSPGVLPQYSSLQKNAMNLYAPRNECAYVPLPDNKQEIVPNNHIDMTPLSKISSEENNGVEFTTKVTYMADTNNPSCSTIESVEPRHTPVSHMRQQDKKQKPVYQHKAIFAYRFGVFKSCALSAMNRKQ